MNAPVGCGAYGVSEQVALQVMVCIVVRKMIIWNIAKAIDAHLLDELLYFSIKMNY